MSDIDHINEEFYDIQDELNVTFYLLEALKESQILTESEARNIESKSRILNEGSVLVEAAVKNYSFKGHSVSWEEFSRVYFDYDQYPEYEDIIRAFGILWKDKKELENYKRDIRRMATAFNDAGHKDPSGGEIVSPSERKDHYSRLKSSAEERGEAPVTTPPSKDDVDRGERNKRNKLTTAIDKINKREALPGAFYANISRIPKATVWRWLTFWKRDVARALKRSERGWKKYFIMGYQVEPNALWEVWFNSYDSSFTIHDINGAQLGRRYATLEETMRHFMQYVSKVGEETEDASIFQSPTNMLKASIETARSLHPVLSPHMKQLMDKDEKEYKRELAELRLKQRSATKTARAVKSFPMNVIKKTVSATTDVADYATNISKTELERRRRREEAIEREREEAESRARVMSWKHDAELELRNKQADADFVSGEIERKRREAEEERQKREKRNARRRERAEERRKAAEESKKRAEEAQKELERLRKEREELRKETEKRAEEARRAMEQLRRETSGAPKPQPRKRGRNRKVKESEEITFDDLINENLNISIVDSEPSEKDLQLIEVTNIISSPEYDRRVERIVRSANSTVMNFSSLKQAITDNMLEYYGQNTRVKNAKWMGGSYIGRSRPGDSVFKRVKSMFRGSTYRADFVAGFSLKSDVNIEIWYVTEPNMNEKGFWFAPTISSFYVYDITSQKLIRKNLPFFRNAMQVAIHKIGFSL